MLARNSAEQTLFVDVVLVDVILKVLEGAKPGTKISVKKDEFLVGRSPSCHLTAGSSSVSRKHCVFVRRDGKLYVKDLGSRNGTVVNGEKITKARRLSSGDEIAIGSLKFTVSISAGINNSKMPEVKSVADAVERSAGKSSDNIEDDDITKWLSEPESSDDSDIIGSSQSLSETQAMGVDETNTPELRKAAEELADQHKLIKEEEVEKEAHASEEGDEEVADEKEGDTKSKKKEPGKLPAIPKNEDKDSREAAMRALRNWNRRR